MTIQDSYRMVIEAEIRSQKLYQALANSFAKHETADVFNELVLLEKNHEAKIRAAYAQEFPSQELVLQNTDNRQLTGVNLTDPKDVLEFAISREELAQSIYLSLAAQTNDAGIKALLQKFAAEEADHKTLLLAEIQKLHGALTWYDPSELNGLVED